MNPKSLLELLTSAWPEPAEFSKNVARLERAGLQDVREAEGYCLRLEQYAKGLEAGQERPEYLHPLVSLFQEGRTPDVELVLRVQGLPVLARLFEFVRGHLPEQAEDGLFVLKMMVMFAESNAGAQWLLEALRENYGCESYVWGVIFEHLTAEHPWTREVCEAVRRQPPEAFCGVCALDLGNELAETQNWPHPFETEAGLERLRGWLESDDPDEESYAESAIRACALFRLPEAEEMLHEALEHDSEGVQLAAAEVLARREDPVAFDKLQELAGFPPLSARACRILKEVGRENLIPEETTQPEFQALASICAWLSDEENFGEIPDEVEFYAQKRIFWPPTNDEREFRFFRYHYVADCEGDSGVDEIGVGVVGSETCSLVGHTDPEMPVEHILALHCCWELQQRGDSRAPGLLSIDEGLLLLKLPKTTD